MADSNKQTGGLTDTRPEGEGSDTNGVRPRLSLGVPVNRACTLRGPPRLRGGHGGVGVGLERSRRPQTIALLISGDPPLCDPSPDFFLVD